ncbi:MAG: hypothetical protein ACFB15_26685 [Cyclobacteriaceae bacterium]
MKIYPILTSFLMLIVILSACQSEEDTITEKSQLKALLHQQHWQLIALEATTSDGTITQNWYESLPDCIRDNVFVTLAPGTGEVGEIQAEERTMRCTPDELHFHPHVAGWKLNEARHIFSVELFDVGHRMLYGYELGASYHTENWHLEQLDEKIWQVKVPKVRDGTEYQVLIRFQSLPL